MTGVRRRNQLAGNRACRILSVTLMVTVLCSTPGCWGKRELEERSFVTLLGIDTANDGSILATVVIAVPRALGGGGRMGGGGTSAAAVRASGSGKNIEEAMRKIEVLNARELTTVHLSVLVLGEDFARSDVGPVIDVFSRSLEFRPTTLVATCKGRAVDFLKGFEAFEEIEPSLYLSKMITTSHSSVGGCPLVTMHDFMVGYNTLSSDSWAPYVGLSSASPAEEVSEEAPKGDGAGAGGEKREAQSAEEPRKIVQLHGTAVFRKVGPVYKMVGSLDMPESMAALLMRGELPAGFLDVAYPGDQAETTLALHDTLTSSHVTIDGSTVDAAFRVVATASLSESRVGAQLPETDQGFRLALTHTAEEELASLLAKTFAKLTSLGSDVLGLGRRVQASFSTYAEWEAFGWPTHFPSVAASFNVKLHILAGGFTIEKPSPR